MGDYGYLASSEAWPKAKTAAMQALDIDNTLAEAHTSLGLAKEPLSSLLNGASVVRLCSQKSTLRLPPAAETSRVNR